MFETVSKIPGLESESGLILPAVSREVEIIDRAGVARKSNIETPFSAAEFLQINDLVGEFLKIGRFIPFQGESRYRVALVAIDPDAKIVSDLDESFRRLTASRSIIDWFQEQSGMSGLWIDTLQINLMDQGDFSRLHTHVQNRQSLNSVLLLQGASDGGQFSTHHTTSANLTDASPHDLQRGEMVIFNPNTPHGVTKVDSGRRFSLVWGISQYESR